jgi:hypothetical protein
MRAAGSFGKRCALRRLVSDSGSKVPVSPGVDTPCANVIPGVCVVEALEGAFCDAVSLDIPPRPSYSQWEASGGRWQTRT